MQSLHAKQPIYPLLSFLTSTAIFFFGLFISKDIAILYFLAGLTVLYVIFGYARALYRGALIFALIGAIVGLGASLTGGPFVGIQTFGRVMLLAYASIIMVALPPVRLTRNLVQLKFPRILTLGMLITIRFVPILIEETRHIREAMKTRGAQVSLVHASCVYRAFLLPFIMRIISMSDIMSVSLETRGFSMTEHRNTLYQPVFFTYRDGAFATMLTIIMIGVYIFWAR